MDEQTVKEKEKQQLLLKLDGYKPINTIYAGYFQDGASSYNTGKYDEALRDFKGALDAREYMFSKGWITQKFDTISTLYAGIAAEKARTTGHTADLRHALEYLDNRDLGNTVDTVNHLHDKPIEVNMNHSLSERFRLAHEKAEKRVHAGR